MEEGAAKRRSVVYRKKRINRKTKLHLVFDENARREFLTGFHKRKLERKRAAQEQLEKQLKDERKRLKQEARESYKKLVVSHKPIPELEEFESKEYDLENHTVSILELSSNEMAKKNNWIGLNRVRYEEDKDDDDDAGKDSDETEEDVPGMELKCERDIKKILKKEATKKVKKSKVFQAKNKLERQKNKKKSRKIKYQRIKIRSKRGKNKKGN
ncbi:nucleolar protein 12 [Bacillus rossius redtenbacheri]|uniref:nucleolar protein 12 n=1 Tax=Bacillus rossius redtenbacheri TaxID=93214 RepID=UPI002FDE5F5B